MLNISKNPLPPESEKRAFTSRDQIVNSSKKIIGTSVLFVVIILTLLSLFLPWTQNIQAKGYVTTRFPGERPQGIPSVLEGKIEQWFVAEGDFVKAGDTIVHISEVNSSYLDPAIVERTTEQRDAKAQSLGVYDSKIAALNTQMQALRSQLQIKLSEARNKIVQARNKIQIDSTSLQVEQQNLLIAQNQLERVKSLYDQGLKSLSDLQDKELKYQQTVAKVDILNNKYLNTQNSLLNAQLYMEGLRQEYADKIAKAESNIQSTLNEKLTAVGDVSKIQNQLSTYTERSAFHYIKAPQDGYIIKTMKKGLGEIVKKGTEVVTIMPSNVNKAVEIYVRPQDLPLMNIGNIARLRFDGWPAIVISGWPKASTGIFTGEVVAIDKFISDNGYYRVMISPKEDTKYWPELLSVGTGTQTFVLLKNVPIWYEMWRLLNGFPPDYYTVDKNATDDAKRKVPLKFVK